MQWKLNWDSWLEERVSWGGGENYIPRWMAIHRFVAHGLLPFVTSKGYQLGCSLSQLRSRVASGLYNNEGLSSTESDWNIAVVNDDFLEYDQAHYWHVISRGDWEVFWAKWGVWSDVSNQSWRGEDRRIDLEDYVWKQIDLERSAQTRVVNEVLGIVDDGHDEGWRAANAMTREDVYLREAAESGEWGGYRR